MSKLTTGLNNVMEFASDQAEGFLGNPVAAAVGGAVVGGAVVGAVAIAARSRKKSTRKAVKKRSSKARKRSRSRRKPKYARTAGKRKDTSTKRIRMTKNGQPYVIMKSGKARFISKSSARASRRRKGGRY